MELARKVYDEKNRETEELEELLDIATKGKVRHIDSMNGDGTFHFKLDGVRTLGLTRTIYEVTDTYRHFHRGRTGY